MQAASCFDDLAGAGDEGGFLEQVGGRVAADGELGKEHEISASVLGAAGEFEDLLGVSVKVADGGVDLGERDLHTSSVAIGGRPAVDQERAPFTKSLILELIVAQGMKKGESVHWMVKT